MTDHRRVTINHEAESAFARLAERSWLTVTDDTVVPDGLGDLPEFYFRMGMLTALQIVGQARRERRWRVIEAAVADALVILKATNP